MKILFIAVLLILISTTSIAQVNFSPEEMFRWFPEGKYEGVGFKDNEAAQTLPGFKKMERATFGATWNGLMLLPESLKKHWLTMVEMNSVKIVVSSSGKEIRTSRAARTGYYSVAGKSYVTNHFGYRMQVIRFPADLDLRKLALSSGSVEKTELLFANMSVYLTKVKKTKWKQEDFYFCITPENDVLACVEPKLLEKMVKTGNGELPSVIDNFPFPYLFDLLPELHHCWQLYDWSAAEKGLVKSLTKNNVNSDDIDNIRKYDPFLNDYIFDGIPCNFMITLPVDALFPNDFLTEALEYRQNMANSENPLDGIKRFKVGEVQIIARVFTDAILKDHYQHLDRAKQKRLEILKEKAKKKESEEK